MRFTKNLAFVLAVVSFSGMSAFASGPSSNAKTVGESTASVNCPGSSTVGMETTTGAPAQVAAVPAKNGTAGEAEQTTH